MHSNHVYCVVLAFIFLFSIGPVWADDPNESGPETICYPTYGTTEDTGGCPSWNWVFSRNGTDGGQLTVHVDGCQIVTLAHYEKPQSGGTGKIADLEMNDIFIEWDEDRGDGNGSQKRFHFTGTYEIYDVPEPDKYVKVESTDPRTVWTVYRVISSGTLSKTSDCCSEHDAIHLQRNWMEFDKDDGIGDPEEPVCISPADEIHYTICWNNTSIYDFEDCYLIDWLPAGASYPGGDWQIFFDPNLVITPPDPNYDSDSHTYAYLDIGTIAVSDTGCVTLDLVVNGRADPGSNLHNVADLYSGDTLIARATVDTSVCCWDDTDPNIIYVDWTAEGDNNGTDWQNSYTNLADALERATDSNCISEPYTIYVAQGIYDPNETPDTTFALPEGCEMYGGFPSGGCEFSQRKPKKYEAILTGLIASQTRVDTVVTLAEDCVLDGFTITESSADGQAIFASGADCSIANCEISQNDGYGAYFENSNVEFTFSRIRDNGVDGIFHSGSGYFLTVENCWIQRCGQNGLFCSSSTPIIRNSNLTESDLAQEGRAGVRLFYPASQAILQNVTVAHNKTFGIWRTGGTLPDINNSIVFHNGGPALVGFSADDAASYSCIEDCNSVNNNISTDPQFAYFDPNNIRITSDSPCHDSGLTLQENYTQVDMDNRTRVLGTAVDRGAYEIECEDVSNELDWNADGLVNLIEFAKFSGAWLSHDPNDPGITTDPNLINEPHYVDPITYAYWQENWDPMCNLDDTEDADTEYEIDLADLVVFCGDSPQNWLWSACWKNDELYEMMGMSGGGESMMMEMPMESATTLESTSIEAFEETNPYAEMSNPELALFVKGIFEVIDSIDTSILEDHENTENLTEAKEFLEDVLSDIKASRQ
jgi:hypothetical protein